MSELKRQLVLPDEGVAATAAGWFALQRSGDMTITDAAELSAWLDADPAHAVAFRKAETTWRQMEEARAHPAVLTLREEARAAKPAWFGLAATPVRTAASIAAAIVITALAAGGLYSWDGVRLLFGPTEQHLQTSVGQRTTVTLPDGSVVTLDTDTEIRTAETRRERRVVLTRGQAYFRVAKDARRPFVVVAGDRTVTALGTAFGVRLEDGRFELAMVEGVVKVEAPLAAAAGGVRRMQSANLSAGSKMVAVEDRQWTVRPADPVKETGWTRGLLMYESTPLARVAEELNRYSERKIVIEDPELGRRLVNGTFRANDIDGAVTALETYGLVRVSSETDDTIRLAAR